MENLNENVVVVYDDLADIYFEDEDGEPCEYRYYLAEEDFENIFEGFEGEFIICGTVGLWDGKREGHSTKVFNSVKEAIIECNNGFYGNMCISEEEGKLLVDVSHHDGSNSLEIRELTEIGSDMWNIDYCSVEQILSVKDATCDVQFVKRKKLSDLDTAIKYSKIRINGAESVEDKEIWERYLKNILEEKQELEEELQGN